MFDSGMMKRAFDATERMRVTEVEMCRCLDAYNNAKEQLEREKSRLMIEKEIDGRNEHEREAQMIVKLKPYKDRVLASNKAYQFAKAEWHYARQLAEIWTLAGYLGRKETFEYGGDV